MDGTGRGNGMGGHCHSEALVRRANPESRDSGFASRPGMTEEVTCMAGNSKFALAEWPEPGYTASNRDLCVLALTSGVRTL
jgi:hypothetical protein